MKHHGKGDEAFPKYIPKINIGYGGEAKIDQSLN
jgi:hypothetical protein